MLLHAGILLAFLASAHAEPPRSPVRLAITASTASTAAPLPEIIKALDADGKTRALAALDRLDRAAIDPAALAELSEAYRLLGRSNEALNAARALSSRDTGSSAGDAQAILTMAQAGDYAGARTAAENGLKRFPGDKDLLGLLHQVKDRHAGGASVEPAAAAQTQSVAAGDARESPETRVLVLRIQDARRRGDMPAAVSLSQELMRTEPSSRRAQDVYLAVAKESARSQRASKVIGDLERAGEADDNEATRKGSPNPSSGNGGIPLWPLLPAAGLSAAAFVVNKSRKTVESEDGFNESDRPQPGELQRFVAGSILAGLAGAGLYLGGAMALEVGAPLAARFMSGPGQQALNLATSEAGAINPRQANAANEVPKMLARVIPFPVGSEVPPTIGKAGSMNVFVTAAEDVAGLNAQQLQSRLGIQPSARYLVMRFPAPKSTIATPILHIDPQFVGRGLTIGKAREFVIPNVPIPTGTTLEIIK